MKRPEPRGLIVIRGYDELTVSAELNIVHRLRMPTKLRDQFSIERIPNAHRVVSARRHHKLPIGTEERVCQRPCVPFQLFDELTIGGPKPRRAVATARHDLISIRAETHTRNDVLVVTKLKLHLTGGNIPHCRWILTGRQSAEHCAWTTFGREHCSIGAEGKCSLRASQPIQCDYFVTIKAPDHRFLVISLGRKVNLIGAERNLTDRSRVATQDFDRLPRCSFPHTHRVVVADAHHIFAIRTEDGAMHCRSMSLKFSHERSVSAVPKSHHTIDTGSRDQLAVRTKVGRVAGDALSQLSNNLLRVRVPQSHLVVHRARDDELAVVTEFRGGDLRAVISQRSTNVREREQSGANHISRFLRISKLVERFLRQ